MDNNQSPTETTKETIISGQPLLNNTEPSSYYRLSRSSEVNTSKPRVFIIYTGGTMGMKKDTVCGVLVPEPDFLAQQLASFPEMKSDKMPQYDIVEFSPLLDSSDMSHEEWHHIAKLIEQHYFDYDGFVVIHGTDTMAFTASALAFMLENLGKTVVVTGSQVSIAEIINDGRKNLITSIIVAGTIDIPEVCIFSTTVFFVAAGQKRSIHGGWMPSKARIARFLVLLESSSI